jgi:hypothetical protein
MKISGYIDSVGKGGHSVPLKLLFWWWAATESCLARVRRTEDLSFALTFLGHNSIQKTEARSLATRAVLSFESLETNIGNSVALKLTTHFNRIWLKVL